MENKMNAVIVKITSAFTADLKETFKDFAYHLAKEWEVDESKVPEAIASYKHTSGKGAAAKKTKAKNAKDPNAPKRPHSAYLFFCAARRPELKEEGYSAQEIMTQLGAEWRELAEEDRTEYKTLAEENKVQYEKEMKEYSPPTDIAGDSNAAPKKGKVPTDKRTKQMNAMKIAEKKSNDDMDGKLYCYNLSTSRTLVYNDKKPGDRSWDTDNHLCAKAQEEIDDFLSNFKTEEDKETENDTEEEDKETENDTEEEDKETENDTEEEDKENEGQVEENIDNTDDEASDEAAALPSAAPRRSTKAITEVPVNFDDDSDDEELKVQLAKQNARREAKKSKCKKKL